MNKKIFVIGSGLSGLVASTELLKKGYHVTMLDQEPRQAIGGQAYWSFGGLFLVNSKIQQRLGVKDSYELALNDWLGSHNLTVQMMRTIGRNNGLKRTCDLPLLKRKTI